MGISRRRFLETAALSGVAAQPLLAAEVDGKSGMPTRILGKTGARVSILAPFALRGKWLTPSKTNPFRHSSAPPS